nr:V-type ATP synthase subunit D [uncultured Solibaculum sp.]
MNQQISPTKGNLMDTKRSLAQAKLGFELLDRKRNILIREVMLMIDKAKSIQERIDMTYAEAYLALQQANISLGICDEIASTVPVENGLEIQYRSVMGVEIPMVHLESTIPKVYYGFESSNSLLDEAYFKFDAVKKLTAELAEVENSVYRLANAIRKTQKRANALKNIMIPRFEETVKFITNALDEKDREEFSRLKVIKRQKSSKAG